MARFLSQVYSTISGSVGGLTYCNTGTSGIISRPRRPAPNICTNYQSLYRSLYTGNCRRWHNISESLRNRWNDYSSTCLYHNSTGNYTISGRLTFISNLTVSDYCMRRRGSPYKSKTTAPVLPGFLIISSVRSVPYPYSGHGITLKLLNESDEDIFIYAFRSIGFSSTSNVSNGKFTSSVFSWDVIGPHRPGQLTFWHLIPGLVYYTRVRAFVRFKKIRLSSQFILRHVCQ